MPDRKTTLEPGNYYHIYNRGINSCNLFLEPANYEHFLELYDKYITPVANTFAWALMRNHFHLLVQILPSHLLNPQGFQNLEGLKEPTAAIEKRINQQFSNLFNAYTKAFNKRYRRTGSLFEHTFRRKQITSEDYLKKVVAYIHLNPVHHGICEHPVEYPWSSYLTCLSIKSTKLHRETVIGWFDNQANFKYWHQKKLVINEMEEWLELTPKSL